MQLCDLNPSGFPPFEATIFCEKIVWSLNEVINGQELVKEISNEIGVYWEHDFGDRETC